LFSVWFELCRQNQIEIKHSIVGDVIGREKISRQKNQTAATDSRMMIARKDSVRMARF
jgi:hypothetical protein